MTATSNHQLWARLDNPRMGKRALRELQARASEGDPDAQFCIADWLEARSGSSHGNAEAIEFLEKAARAGYTPAQVRLGVWLEHRDWADRDYVRARRLYRLAARHGDATAAYNLGVDFEEGCGVARNLGRALKWFRVAADHDIRKGWKLAEYLLLGLGGASEATRALALCRRLVRIAGFGEQAGFLLGYAYETGTGVDASVPRALHWYRWAANEGEPAALARMAHLKQLTGKRRTPDLVFPLWLAAAEEGVVCAQAEVGRSLISGVGTAPDTARGESWLRRAMENKNTWRRPGTVDRALEDITRESLRKAERALSEQWR